MEKLRELEQKLNELMKEASSEASGYDPNIAGEDDLINFWLEFEDKIDKAHSYLIFELPKAIETFEKEKINQ